MCKINKILISMINEELHWDLKTLFLFLTHSTLTISCDSASRVYNDMAKRLIEWNGTKRSTLRLLFNELHIRFEELCTHCGEELDNYSGNEEEPYCTRCLDNSK